MASGMSSSFSVRMSSVMPCCWATHRAIFKAGAETITHLAWETFPSTPVSIQAHLDYFSLIYLFLYEVLDDGLRQKINPQY